MKDLIHEHKWKRGSEEKAATVEEISRKTTLIGPAYNKGAVQYLPSAGLSDSTNHRRSTRDWAPTTASCCTWQGAPSTSV